MNNEIIVLPAKWHPKRTFPKKPIPKNVLRFPEVMTLTRKIRIEASK